MSQPPGSAPSFVRVWWDAFAAVAAAVAAMFAVAALGLWAAGADGLPGAFPSVTAATVVSAVGGTVELTGSAGVLGRTGAALDVVPLSVTLAGAITLAVVFLRPLRHHAVAGGRDLLARVARTAVLWLIALLLIALGARHTFRIDLGDSLLGDIGEVLDVSPGVGFRAAVGPTLGYGLLWLLVLLAVAVAASRKTPLPSRLLRFQDPVRPAAFAVLALLLGYVVLGLLVGLVAAVTRGDPAGTMAAILLGLPNLAWIALGLGLGGSWEGRVPGQSLGLPLPKALTAVLREGGEGSSTVTVSSLAQHDGRAWLLVVVAAIALLAAGFLLAVRSPATMRPWEHALQMGVALALTLFVVGTLTRISARVGLSLLGIGDLSSFGGEVTLRPHLLTLTGVGLLWGIVAGYLGSLLSRRAGRRGPVEETAEPERGRAEGPGPA
ncbi:streptophobe family protein [Streptomyces sp. URMC 124]|uniref:streptophobe family protein n=1 Tax=Streptomyces sp. URMC 124 TaxID=3423405 RepID=UPI003F1C3B98